MHKIIHTFPVSSGSPLIANREKHSKNGKIATCFKSQKVSESNVCVIMNMPQENVRVKKLKISLVC